MSKEIKKDDIVILTNDEEVIVLDVFQNYDNVRVKNIKTDQPFTVKKKDIKSIVIE